MTEQPKSIKDYESLEQYTILVNLDASNPKCSTCDNLIDIRLHHEFVKTQSLLPIPNYYVLCNICHNCVIRLYSTLSYIGERKFREFHNIGIAHVRR